jgi:hypothetical protein
MFDSFSLLFHWNSAMFQWICWSHSRN